MAFFEKMAEISNIHQLLEKVDLLLGANRIDSVYLRGHACYEWRLEPTIARPLSYAGMQTNGYTEDREKYLLNRFRRYIRVLLNRDVDEPELVFLARHHGVPVRLVEDYRQDDFDIARIEKWRIPSNAKIPLLFALERCGINERRLFPDLDGIARGIIQTEVLRTGNPISTARVVSST